MDIKNQAHYVAFITLKQRCEYLQQRLNVLEEENCSLKLDKALEISSKTTKPSLDNNSYEKQIIFLKRQLSRQAHELELISNENKNLWKRLSKLLPEGDDLGENLCIKSDQQDMKIGQSVKNITVDDCGKESLEEISLKLINGILMGKSELENQYSQMIDLQKDVSGMDVKNFLHFSMQIDEKSALNNINNYLQKLKDFKQALYQQKSELCVAISKLKVLKHNPTSSRKINSNESVKNENNNFCIDEDINSQENSNSYSNINSTSQDNENCRQDKICPMCGVVYTGSQKNFYQHVTGHFEDEDDEYVDASASFEITP